MQTNNILSLLHDTYLKEIKLNNNNEIHFFFTFSLENNQELKVEFISHEISNISCVESNRSMQTNNLDIKNVKEVYCIKVEQNNENIEILLEDIVKDTIIEIKYKSHSNKYVGNIEELKQFWDVLV